MNTRLQRICFDSLRDIPGASTTIAPSQTDVNRAFLLWRLVAVVVSALANQQQIHTASFFRLAQHNHKYTPIIIFLHAPLPLLNCIPA